MKEYQFDALSVALHERGHGVMGKLWPEFVSTEKPNPPDIRSVCASRIIRREHAAKHLDGFYRWALAKYL